MHPYKNCYPAKEIRSRISHHITEDSFTYVSKSPGNNKYYAP
jgi:hypothetical protein